MELKIDDGKPVAAPAPVASAPSAPPPPAPRKSPVDATMVMSRGVKMSDLEESGTRVGGFDTNAAFSKKSNKTNRVFLVIGIVVGVVIIGLIVYALNMAK